MFQFKYPGYRWGCLCW